MFIEDLLKKLKEHRQEAENMLYHGSVEDFASYRYLTGKIKGIDDAMEIIKEMFRKADDEF